MAKDLAIILNNGGINSAVATALAAQKYRPILLFAETGGATAGRSRAAYDQQVAHFKPFREHTLAMPFVGTVEPPPAVTLTSVAVETRVKQPSANAPSKTKGAVSVIRSANTTFPLAAANIGVPPPAGKSTPS